MVYLGLPDPILSIGRSYVYGGSRTLMFLAETGYAPSIFAYVDRSGRPLWARLCPPLQATM